MDYKRYTIIPLAGLVVVISFFIVFQVVTMSTENQRKIQMRTQDSGLSPEEHSAVPSQVRVKQKHALRSSDPAQYHITTRQGTAMRDSRLYWESAMRKTLDQSDAVNRMSQGDAFKGIKATPEQFQKKLLRIDGRILEYEQRIHNNPGDDHARQKLQDLYILRSTVSNLEKAVVVTGP